MIKALEDYYAIKPRYDDTVAVVEKETQRVVNVLTKFFKSKDFWWAFKYYEGENCQTPDPGYIDSDEFFPIYIDANLESKSFDYSNGFPVKFFEMTDEEIVKYLIDEAESDKQEEVEEEKKKELKKKKKQAIERQAVERLNEKLSKIENLTPEEKKLLRKGMVKL
jgi:hypothetical protein